MKKADDYIKERMEKEPNFEARYNLITQKAKIVKKIIEYRNRHNLSQAQLAQRLGVTQQYISKIEEGEFSNLEVVENLLYRLGYWLKLDVVRLSKKEAEHLIRV